MPRSKRIPIDAVLASLDQPNPEAPAEPSAAELTVPGLASHDLTDPQLEELAEMGRLTFESVHDPCTKTNDHHVKLLLGELPYMRMGVMALSMSDQDLEAKIRGAADPEGAMELYLQVAETLTGIEKRYQAAVDICRDAAERFLIVLSRIYEQEERRGEEWKH